MSKLFVSKLNIYPIKSAAGLSLKAMQLNPMGPECDRRWMIVDSNNVFITQRKFSKMCLLNVNLTSQGLELSSEGYSPCSVTIPEDRHLIESSVWGSDAHGLDCGDHVAQWLSDFLGKSCRLIYMPDDYQRAVDTNYVKDNEKVAFADGFPLLVTSQSSLDDFNSKLSMSNPGLEIGMNRFRPNIVISGNDAYAEDEWQIIRIGDIEVSLVKPCSRCIMPSINPASGQKEIAVNQTLQKYRKRGRDTFFGQNAVYSTLGEISLGDEVTIIKRHES